MGLNHLFSNIKQSIRTSGQKSASADSKIVVAPDFDTERLDQILRLLRERTYTPVIRIEATEAEETLGLTVSKFGGYPYWQSDLEYPTNESGEKLYLLAQLNLEEIQEICQSEDFAKIQEHCAQNHAGASIFPQKGLLQFFITGDDLHGCSFPSDSTSKGFRVIYHPQIQEAMTIQEMTAAGIPSNTTSNLSKSCLPSFKEYALTFKAGRDYMTYSVTGFEEYSLLLAEEITSEKLTGEYKNMCNYLSKPEYDYFLREMDSFGHKLLGYPAFTQCDPRHLEDPGRPDFKLTTTHYDTLLFQMDTDREILWGDSGICNFFINSDALAQCDFSDVLYNWDCF